MVTDVLTPETARELRRIGKRVKESTVERNRLIRNAAADGGSLREIAKEVGISHVAVKKILERDRDVTD